MASSLMSRRQLVALGCLALTSVMLSMGCQNHSPAAPAVTPNQTQNTQLAPSNPAPPVAPSGLPTAANGADLTVTVTDSSGAVAGAQVAAFGPTLVASFSASDGTVEMSSLPTGSYTVRVDAAGHVGATASFAVTAPRQTLSVAIGLPVATQTVTGKVVDAGGNALAGARVVQGAAWTMTAADGTYELPVASAGTITVKKTGYTPATTTGGTVALTSGSPKVAFENSPFAGDYGAASAAFSSLEGALSAMGWTVENQDDPAADVRVWAAPSTLGSVDPADVAAYVQGGGKIVVMGEWGGATDYRPDLADSLLLPVGAAIDTDLVRLDSSTLGRPEWFSPTLGATPASSGVGSVEVFGAASVESATPMQVVAGIPSGGYQVQSLDPLAVGVARQEGTGLVVALGDTAAWLNDASDDVGQMNNLTFARNLITW